MCQCCLMLEGLRIATPSAVVRSPARPLVAVRLAASRGRSARGWST